MCIEITNLINSLASSRGWDGIQDEVLPQLVLLNKQINSLTQLAIYRSNAEHEHDDEDEEELLAANERIADELQAMAQDMRVRNPGDPPSLDD